MKLGHYEEMKESTEQKSAKLTIDTQSNKSPYGPYMQVLKPPSNTKNTTQKTDVQATRQAKKRQRMAQAVSQANMLDDMRALETISKIS